MKQIHSLVVLSLITLTASCATTRPSLSEVKLPPDRITQKGYSLVPLNEPGWKIAGRDGLNLALVKFGANTDETFALEAKAYRLPTFGSNADFLQLMKEIGAKNSESQRFKLLQHEVALFPMKDVTCAKSHTIVEDRAAVKRSNDSRDMLLDIIKLSCAHPSENTIGIDVIYSHRHYPGQEDASFGEKGTSILSSVALFRPDYPFISPDQKANLELVTDVTQPAVREAGNRLAGLL